MNYRIRLPAGLLGWIFVSALAGAVLTLGLAAWLLTSWPPLRVALLGTPLAAVTIEPVFTRSAPTATVTESPAAPPSPTSTSTNAPSPTPTPMPTATATATVGLEELIARAAFGIVTVVNAPGVNESGRAIMADTIWGSGVIIDARGYVLTNQHVVRRVGQLVVLLPGAGEVPASHIAGDEAADLALLRLNAPGSFAAVPWGESRSLRVGQYVAVVGTPLGNLPGSVTMGVISGLDRTVKLTDETEFRGLIQTDADINYGNSGGALLNSSGELVGLVTLMLRDGGVEGWSDVQGIGFAIPVNAVRPLVNEWIAVDNPGRTSPLRLDGGR